VGCRGNWVRCHSFLCVISACFQNTKSAALRFIAERCGLLGAYTYAPAGSGTPASSIAAAVTITDPLRLVQSLSSSPSALLPCVEVLHAPAHHHYVFADAVRPQAIELICHGRRVGASPAERKSPASMCVLLAATCTRNGVVYTLIAVYCRFHRAERCRAQRHINLDAAGD